MMICPMTNSVCGYTAPCVGICRHVVPTNTVAARIAALEAENAETKRVLPCGHHHSLLLKSAETGEPLYCEYCDCISRRNDFEAESERYRKDLADAAGELMTTMPTPGSDMARVMIANALMRDERDRAKAEWTELKIESEGTILALRAEVERLRPDAERYRWLTTDHDDTYMRDSVKRIAESIRISGKGYIDAAIDAAKERK